MQIRYSYFNRHGIFDVVDSHSDSELVTLQRDAFVVDLNLVQSLRIANTIAHTPAAFVNYNVKM